MYQLLRVWCVTAVWILYEESLFTEVPEGLFKYFNTVERYLFINNTVYEVVNTFYHKVFFFFLSYYGDY